MRAYQWVIQQPSRKDATMPDYSRTRTISHSSANLFQVMSSSPDLWHLLPDPASVGSAMGTTSVPWPGSRTVVSLLPDPVTTVDSDPSTSAGPSTAVLEDAGQPAGADSTWVTVLEEEHRIEWGRAGDPAGDDEYRGELQIDPVGCGAYVTIHLHTRRHYHGMDPMLEESLNRIADLVR